MATAVVVPDNKIHRVKDFWDSPSASAAEQQGENQGPKPLGVQKCSHSSGQSLWAGQCAVIAQVTGVLFARWPCGPVALSTLIVYKDILIERDVLK